MFSFKKGDIVRHNNLGAGIVAIETELPESKINSRTEVTFDPDGTTLAVSTECLILILCKECIGEDGHDVKCSRKDLEGFVHGV